MAGRSIIDGGDRHGGGRLRRRSRRWPFVAAGFLFILAALIGAAFARGWLATVDRMGLLALGTAVAPHAAIADAVSGLGDPVVRIVLVAVATVALLVARRPRDAMFLVLTVASGSLLVTLLKAGIGRPRPDLLPHLVIVRNASFPSGHAANSALVYGTLALVLRQTRAGRPLALAAVLIALLVGLSRIGLAVHWPSDVAGGWTIGAGWLLFAHGLREASPWRSRSR